MITFISHSFDNKPQFHNIADALKLAGVQYWDPSDIKPGSSLRDQLRHAVERCSDCVFVATQQSLKSSWCGAELGAFWGAGKPIIVHVAEPSLTEGQLPQIVQGDVWEERIMRVVDRVKELHAESTTGDALQSSSPRVGSMTVEQLEKLIVSAVSLGAAVGKTVDRATPSEIGLAAKNVAGRVLEGAKTADRVRDTESNAWRKHVLWVDDMPDNQVYERSALESLGVEFTLAPTTREALDILSHRRFAAIISDMGRAEGPQEGYVLLSSVREKDKQTPFFIYSGSNAPEHKHEAMVKGAQGSTNRAQELFDMVVRVLGDIVTSQ